MRSGNKEPVVQPRMLGSGRGCSRGGDGKRVDFRCVMGVALTGLADGLGTGKADLIGANR